MNILLFWDKSNIIIWGTTKLLEKYSVLYMSFVHTEASELFAVIEVKSW